MEPKSAAVTMKKKILLTNLGKNLLLVFLSLMFALGLVEVALRINNPLGFRIKGNKILLPINQDEVIYYHSPKLAQVVKIHRNSLGFKGEEPPADFAARSDHPDHWRQHYRRRGAE